MIWDNNDDIRLIECANDKRTIQRHLNDCREERRPYVFITNTMNIKPLHRLLVPVSMLEEETYKAEICTYIARKTGAHIILLQANDYGSHAKQNVNRIVTHINKINERLAAEQADKENAPSSDSNNGPITYEIVLARKDSFKLVQEAAERQRDFRHDLLILTASRDYGLDDILFGPPERKAIQHALVPVMLVNPREDLFSLCD
ncbi:MAG: universal stress protein [Paludibacteraceae bacterium]|nr:universal stress protein [Paludibacteraceae bacterium]MBQ4017656.1 universal stress protein [Paludibacteraceae bacterium]